MPNAIIDKLIADANISQDEAEKIWNKAKKTVSDEYPDLSENDDKFWKLVTSIAMKMAGLNESDMNADEEDEEKKEPVDNADEEKLEESRDFFQLCESEIKAIPEPVTESLILAAVGGLFAYALIVFILLTLFFKTIFFIVRKLTPNPLVTQIKQEMTMLNNELAFVKSEISRAKNDPAKQKDINMRMQSIMNRMDDLVIKASGVSPKIAREWQNTVAKIKQRTQEFRRDNSIEDDIVATAEKIKVEKQ